MFFLGFGYHGGKLQRFGLEKRKPKHFITTAFDDWRKIDTAESAARRKEDTWNKNRTGYIWGKPNFVKKSL